MSQRPDLLLAGRLDQFGVSRDSSARPSPMGAPRGGFVLLVEYLRDHETVVKRVHYCGVSEYGYSEAYAKVRS
jgi:hypothetical protein